MFTTVSSPHITVRNATGTLHSLLTANIPCGCDGKPHCKSLALIEGVNVILLIVAVHALKLDAGPSIRL